MRVLVINNVKSGQGDAGLYDYVHALGRLDAEVTIRFLNETRRFEAMLADGATFDRVVAAGGDGTVSAVAYALRDTGVPVVAYPAGTANLIAMNLGLPGDPLSLARLTVDGAEVRVDVGELTCEASDGWCALRSGGIVSESGKAGFVMAAGAGFDARIMEGAREFKQLMGVGAYVLSALQNLNPTVARFTLELDGRVVETDGIAVLITNFARIQFDLPLTSAGDAQDGVFEVVILRTKSAAGLLPAVWAAVLDRLGEHPSRPASVEVHTAAAIRVIADPPLPVQFDGEVVAALTPIAARVLPRAATFVVPRGTSLSAE